jgi:hypothetical protein
VADQLAQNAVDMLAYPEGAGPLTTTPHRALQLARENLDYLERFLGPEPVHDDPGSTVTADLPGIRKANDAR